MGENYILGSVVIFTRRVKKISRLKLYLFIYWSKHQQNFFFWYSVKLERYFCEKDNPSSKKQQFFDSSILMAGHPVLDYFLPTGSEISCIGYMYIDRVIIFCTQLYDIKYSIKYNEFANRFIWSIYRITIGIIASSPSGHGSNGNEQILSLSTDGCSLVLYPGNFFCLKWGLTSLKSLQSMYRKTYQQGNILRLCLTF